MTRRTKNGLTRTLDDYLIAGSKTAGENERMENQIVYEDEVLNLEEAARFLKVAARTLQRRRADSGLPAHAAARRCWFLKSELISWLRALPSAPENRVVVTTQTLKQRSLR